MRHILVVDDEAGMRLMLSTFLTREGFQPIVVESGPEALEKLNQADFDLVITDLCMPEMDGLTLLKRIQERGLALPVVVMSAYGSSESALAAMRAGAFDYVFKPFQPDEILFSLKKAEAQARLSRENEALRAAVSRRAGDGLIYKSRVMGEIMALVPKMAETDSTVLITGESGTGKELVARAIHRASRRRDRPFLAVNCGAIAESLLESELFGHVRGAFTGALRDREGLFRAADQGTLFLDEVGELPLSFQVKLLRAIQFSEVRPVGGENTVRFNTRLLAATSRELGDLVREQRFRKDLFYRLNVLPVQLPTLRERREDIPLLAGYFADVLSSRLDRPRPLLTVDFLDRLSLYPWPGNIRELENLMDRLLVMGGAPGERQVLSGRDLPEAIGGPSPAGPSAPAGPADLNLKAAVRELEAGYIRAALARSRGNQSEATRLLGLSYPSLLAKIKRYGLKVDS